MHVLIILGEWCQHGIKAAFIRDFGTGTVLCRTVPFKASTHEQFQTTASLHLSGTRTVLEKIFPPYNCSSKPYTKCSSRANFPVIFSYPQSNFPLPRFKAYLTRTVLGVYTRTFWFGSVRGLLSRWTGSGTASSSVWNGSISSRVNARPICTVLVRLHMEPFPCKRGLNIAFNGRRFVI